MSRKIADEYIPGMCQFFIGSHIAEMSGTFNKLCSALRICAVVHGNQQRFREVQKAHTGAAVTPLTGDSGFHTPDGTVVIGVFFLYTARNERGDDDFIVVECRHSKTELHYFHGLVHKVIRQACMITYGEVRLRQVRLCDGAKDQPRHGIDSVCMLRRLSADCHILVKRRTCTELSMAPGADFVDGEGFEPEVCHELTGSVFGDTACREVSFVVRPEILIHSSVREGVPVGLNLQNEMYKPERLDGFLQGFGGFIGDLAQNPCHFLQLSSTSRLCPGRQILCQIGIALCKILHCLNDDQDSLIEIILLQVLNFRQIQLFHAGTGSGFIGFQAFPQHGFVCHGNMRIPGGEVSFRLDNAEIVEHTAFRRNGGKPFVQQGVVLPEWIDAAEGLFCFLCNIEDIAVTFFKLVQFSDDPIHCIFRENGSCTICGGLIPGKKCFGFDINSHLFQNVLQHIGTAKDDRFVCMQAVALGGEYGALRTDLRSGRE